MKKTKRRVRLTTITEGKVSARVVPVKGNRFLEAWAAVHPPQKRRAKL